MEKTETIYNEYDTSILNSNMQIALPSRVTITSLVIAASVSVTGGSSGSYINNSLLKNIGLTKYDREEGTSQILNISGTDVQNISNMLNSKQVADLWDLDDIFNPTRSSVIGIYGSESVILNLEFASLSEIQDGDRTSATIKLYISYKYLENVKRHCHKVRTVSKSFTKKEERIEYIVSRPIHKIFAKTMDGNNLSDSIFDNIVLKFGSTVIANLSTYHLSKILTQNFARQTGYFIIFDEVLSPKPPADQERLIVEVSSSSSNAKTFQLFFITE